MRPANVYDPTVDRLPRILVPLLLAFTASACSTSSTRDPLCTRERDPLGLFCQAGLADADEGADQARGALPPEVTAGLVRVESSPLGTLTVDGVDETWVATFYSAADDTVWQVTADVLEGTTDATMLDAVISCGPDDGMDSPDSRAVVPDAVRRFEADHGLFQLGANNLFYRRRLPCASPTGALEHHVTFQLGGATLERWFARYDGRARFVDLCGPCAEYEPAACGACAP
jgi:hypothetical protein